MHNIVISGCKDIALHILFLVLFGNSKCFEVGSGVGGFGLGGQGGCERRIEVFVKIQKKKWGGGSGGRVGGVRLGGSGWM